MIELKTVAKIREIKDYESMSEDEPLHAFKASESEKNFDKNNNRRDQRFNDSRHILSDMINNHKVHKEKMENLFRQYNNRA